MIGVLATPPLRAPSNGWVANSAEGRPFLPDHTVDFPQGNFTVLPVICSSVFPLQPPADSFISSFIYTLPFSSATAAFPLRPWSYARLPSAAPARPSRRLLSPCFDTCRCFPVPRCGLGVGSARMATRWRRCSKVKSPCFDWSGRQEAGAGPWRCTRRLAAVA